MLRSCGACGGVWECGSDDEETVVVVVVFVWTLASASAGVNGRTVSGTHTSALKVKLDLQERWNGGAQRSLGSVWTGELLKGTKIL